MRADDVMQLETQNDPLLELPVDFLPVSRLWAHAANNLYILLTKQQ